MSDRPIIRVIMVRVEEFTKSSTNVYDLLAAWSLLKVKKVAPPDVNWVMISDIDMSDLNPSTMTGPVRWTCSYHVEKPCSNEPPCLWELSKIPDKALVIPGVEGEVQGEVQLPLTYAQAEETAVQIEVRKLGEVRQLLKEVMNSSKSHTLQQRLYPAYGVVNRVWQQLVDCQEV